MADASQGAQAQLAMDPSAVDANSEPYEFVSETLQKRGAILDTNAIRGTRQHSKEVTRAGTYAVAGQITLHPTPANLDNLLPRILGATESTDVFDLAETLPEFDVAIDRVAKVFTYTDCKVNRATFRGRAGGLVELVLDLIGKTESVGAAGSFPALTLGVASNDAPYVFQDGVLTLVSSARKMMDFELVIDNALDARFSNSQTATSITPKDLIVTLKTTNPYTSDETDLYGQSTAGSGGTLVFTNGDMSTTFTFGALQVPDLSPSVSGKVEIPLKLEMTARKSGSTAALSVTHDSAA